MSKKNLWITILFALQIFTLLTSWTNAHGSVIEFWATFTTMEIIILGATLQNFLWNNYLKKQTQTQKIITGFLWFGYLALIPVWSIFIYQNAINLVLRDNGKEAEAQVESYQLKSHGEGTRTNWPFTYNATNPTAGNFLIVKLNYNGHKGTAIVTFLAKDFEPTYSAALGHKTIEVKYLSGAPSIVKPTASL